MLLLDVLGAMQLGLFCQLAWSIDRLASKLEQFGAKPRISDIEHQTIQALLSTGTTSDVDTPPMDGQS